MTEPRRPSSGIRVGLADCPKCHGKRRVPLGLVPVMVPCDFCVVDGEPCGKVTLERAGEYFGLEPVTRRETPSSMRAAKLDTDPPDTEPDPEPKE